MNIWLSLIIYRRYFDKYTSQDLFVAPITFWFIVNAVVILYVPGAAFFIISVFAALVVLAFLIFKDLASQIKIGLFVFLSIPMLYTLAPMIKQFPVALGLGALFISAIFIVLIFGLLLPVISLLSIRRMIQIGIGSIAALFFIVATVKSGFSVNSKKPTNIIFHYNADDQVSYWASLNQNQDEYTRQFLGDDSQFGRMPEESRVRGSRARYFKKTENRKIPMSEIVVEKDTLVGGERKLDFTVRPQRKIHRYEFISNNPPKFQ